MMVTEAAGHHDLATNSAHRVEEFFWFANAGKGHAWSTDDPIRHSGAYRRLEERPSSLCGLSHNEFSFRAVSDLQYCVCMAHLVNHSGAHRTTRNDVTVADASACVDNNQRIVHV